MIEDEIDAALDDVARKFAVSEYGFEERYRLGAAARRFSADAWASLAEMGWFSVATPEDRDGLGLRMSSIAVLAEAAGAMFMNEPLSDTAFVGAYLLGALGSDAQQSNHFPELLGGSLRLATALEPPAWLPDAATPITIDGQGLLNGMLPFVAGADIADAILVRATDGVGGVQVHLVDSASAGVEIARYPLADGRGAARITLTGVASERLGDGSADASVALDDALAIGALATAADSLGVMDRALQVTVEYLKTRVQFGRPIGTNQVLQHRAVDMYVYVAEARAVISAAVHAGPVGSAIFAHHVHAAKAIIDASARKVAHEMIQMHGGIGMADEHVAGQCLKRVMVNEQIYGRRRDHLRLFAAGVSDDLDMAGVR
ncbi:acyl-CoA dehydrogenase family protein [Sphingomonas sp. Root710]|uniref:acyl-CoA dehydrogenase family protein n=1 Tax=Sphingomonas sp. Root710 TaxID=1736594 RepID=UPI00138F2CC8|nr:acyl-CoA dehydrogenase [Sphingomonas sp. Root710]